jgi:ABC-type multidrug transport system fused ATPase/permease subunit
MKKAIEHSLEELELAKFDLEKCFNTKSKSFTFNTCDLSLNYFDEKIAPNISIKKSVVYIIKVNDNYDLTNIPTYNSNVSDMINKQSGKVQQELGNLTTQAQETFSAIRVIKAYARETYFTEKMQEKNEVYKKTALKLATIESFFGPAMVLMIGLSVLITVWYGGKLTIQGKIEPGNVTEFIFYVFRLTWPFASLGWVTSLIQRASASQERINEFLNTNTLTILSVYHVWLRIGR